MSQTAEPPADGGPDSGALPAVSSPSLRDIAFTLICVAIVILLLQLMRPVLLPLVLAALLFYGLEQALAVIDQLPAGARKLAASLRAPRDEPSPVEKVQQAADTLKNAGKPSVPSGVTRVQIEEQGFQEYIRVVDVGGPDGVGESAHHGVFPHLLHAVVGRAV